MLSPRYYVDLADGRFNLTTAADLAEVFARLEAAPTRDHLAVHFHGGLVSRASAEAGAEGLLPYYESGGAYPVFFFWHSNLGTTLTKNLDEIASEPVFQRLVKRLIQLALGKLAAHAGARAAGPLVLESENRVPDDLPSLARYANEREPDGVAGVALTESQADAAQAELETDPIVQAESRAIAAAVAPPAPETTVRERAAGAKPVAPRRTRMSAAVVQELAAEHPAPGARLGVVTFATLAIRGVIALRRVIQRFSGGRDHGLYTTVVEELLRELYVDSLGALAWTLMKKDTLDAFGPDPAMHGGTAFVQRLSAWWKPGRHITLIGHSTGAIYIGHFVAHANSVLPAEAKFDVALLAPACSFAFMAEKLPLFEKRVRRIRLFGLKDTLERGYWEVPVIYGASLLYMVSGLFEEPTVDQPLVGMERYFSNAAPYVTPEISAVTAYLAGKCVWSIATGAAGLVSGAERHGGFTEDPQTRDSLREFLRTAAG